MKKLDKLVFKAYIGPFMITLPVIIFIFLVQTILKYIDELVGKDIGFLSFAELVFYFCLNLFPVCLPLAILLGSLIAFGNMGEHNELTAIKSSGISLVRILKPIFLLVIFLTIFVFWFNNVIVPKANLKAYSLLYDLRHKKPALDIREGAFYNGLPGYSIKVAQKFPDGKSLKGIIIYNHSENRGNTQLILADSGQMYSFYNDKYLAIELFKGAEYNEQIDNASNTLFPKKFVRSNFEKTKIYFDLSSFDLKKTEEGLFRGNRMMKNIASLKKDIDSLTFLADSLATNAVATNVAFYNFSKPTEIVNKKISAYPLDTIKVKRFYRNLNPHQQNSMYHRATNSARNIKTQLKSQYDRLKFIKRESKLYTIGIQQKYTQSVICLIFFIIGAPLGAIIKKGGLGIPMILCIIFFIIFYILSMMTEKWIKETEDSVVYFAIWIPILTLLPFGLFFLRQAKNDSKVFDTDIYLIYWDKLRSTFMKNKGLKTN